MSLVVQIAPLASLPTHAAIFDYEWQGSITPQVGMVVEIPFRKGTEYGVVTKIQSSSRFKLKTVEPQDAYALLSPFEVAWLLKLAAEYKVAAGILMQRALPPLSVRTIKTLQRTIETRAKVTQGKLQYLWYSQQNLLAKVIADFSHKTNKPIMIVAPTQFEATQIFDQIAQLATERPIFLGVAESAPKRRELWLSWSDEKQNPIIIGTQFIAWLPKRASAQLILVEPTHAAHVQREGTQYAQRDVLESRRVEFGEDLLVVAHSPATIDLDRALSLPALHSWPVMIDRTTEDPKLRQFFVSPSIEDDLRTSTRTLFFVPHVREATHYICKDCGSLFRAAELTESAACKNCMGTRFSKLGFGAETVANELKIQNVAAHDSQITVLDSERFKADSESYLSAKFVIATAPIFDRLPLAAFDLIVDLSTDFELVHPQFTTEEYLWQRLRAISVRIPHTWDGRWFVQTRVPNLLGWRVRDSEGYNLWWNAEKTLRKRFKQAPFHRG